MSTASPNAVIWLNEMERIVLCNPRAESLFGYSPSDLDGQPWELLIIEHRQGAMRDCLRQVDRIRRPGRLTIEDGRLLGRHRDGREFVLNGEITQLRVGSLVGYQLILRAPTMGQEADGDRHRSQSDPLTALLNRPLFLERLQSAIKRHRTHNHSFALVLLDLSGLNEITATHGQATADQALRRFADRLRASLRPCDTAARFSHDAFTLILEEIVSPAKLMRVIERIERQLALPIELNQICLHVSISIGFALYPQDGNEPMGILERAQDSLRPIRGRHSNPDSCVGLPATTDHLAAL